MTIYSSAGKRAIDLALACTAALSLAPVAAAVAVAIRKEGSDTIIFRQTRAGVDGQPFTILKFTTMLPASTGLSRDARVTPLGSKLRKFSLDEIPQILNVIKGDMSLVGPRPLPTRYTALYTPEQRQRLQVRPGITGLAQISGRNMLSWEDRFSLDIAYVSNVSLLGDLKIIAKTFGRLARSRSGGESTQPSAEFSGSASNIESGH